MIEAKEWAKMRPHMWGQSTRIESAVSVGFPDVVLCHDNEIILAELKIVHGRIHPYFYLEKTQKIWHIQHKTSGCYSPFILFGPTYITILYGDDICHSKMEWVIKGGRGIWKVLMAQFIQVQYKFMREPLNWGNFNYVLFNGVRKPGRIL